MTMQRPKCVCCDLRPRKEGSRYCQTCETKIAAEGKVEREPLPEYYLHYRGVVVGFFRNARGRLSPRRLYREVVRKDAEGKLIPTVPASKLINLDEYVPGYDRGQIKRFKAVIAELAPKFAEN